MVLAVLGLGASVAALYVHYRMLADPSYTSFCDVNATVSGLSNCTPLNLPLRRIICACMARPTASCTAPISSGCCSTRCAGLRRT